MNNWIETSGSPFVIVEQQYAHQWKGQENYNAICSVTDYLGKIYIDNHVLLVMGDEPMATRIVNKDGAILIIRWKYAPDYLTVEKLLENDIVTGAEPIEEVEVKWDSTELVLFDSLSPYCEASVKVFLSLQKTSCIIKTYLYQKDEVSLGEFYQFNLSSCIRQQNSLTAQFVSFSLSNLANIFYPPQFLQ